MEHKEYSLVEELDLCIRSRYPVLYLVTSEEERAVELLEKAGAMSKKEIFTWTGTEGFSPERKAGSSRKAVDALSFIDEYDAPAIFILKDFHVSLDDDGVIRKFRDVVARLRKSHKTVTIVAPTLVLPPGLETAITPFDIPLPSKEELKEALFEIVGPLEESKVISTDFDDQLIEKVINASRGLTRMEARNLFSKLVVRNKTFDESDLPFVVAEKKKLIRKSGILEYYDFSEDMSSIGGLEKLKTWLRKRGMAFSEKAREFGLPEPKGILLLGVQGCGKSLAAKATSSLWNLPLLKLDVGRIFDSYIGSSEKNMREAIKVAESLAPNILWLDEIDKAFSGMGAGNSSDSGTSARVFGTFLTWMQEKKDPVFIIATANNIEFLPPELLRKGRFDEIFFINLPKDDEREHILSIHLKRAKRNPEQFDVKGFAEKSEGFTGAELEQLVISGLYNAYAEERELTNDDIFQEITRTVPLSVTYEEKIKWLQDWAGKRARPAS